MYVFAKLSKDNLVCIFNKDVFHLIFHLTHRIMSGSLTLFCNTGSLSLKDLTYSLKL